MEILSKLLVGLVAFTHIGILVLEMFVWTTPPGLHIFAKHGVDMELPYALASAGLAANMGLYNGFLAAGLIWGLLSKQRGFSIMVFFLSCIIVAGVYGGITINLPILFVQALPAAIALLLVWLARTNSLTATKLCEPNFVP